MHRRAGKCAAYGVATTWVQLGLGRSLQSMRPWRRQPFVASQVRACQVGEGSIGLAGRVRKPSNQAADEQGSMARRSLGWCLRKFNSQ